MLPLGIYISDEGGLVELRELKALEIAARSRITFDGKAWVVPSQSGNNPYRVSIDRKAHCPCEDFALRQADCKHVIAARLVCERDHGGKAPPIVADEVPKKPTYKQNWKAYTAAQNVEKDRFQEMLFDLTRGVQEPDRTGLRGRKPFSMKDSIFAMCLKVYSTFSGRRLSSDLREAHRRGHLDRLMAGLKVCEFLESEAFTPVLKTLIAQSSLPLRAVETKFAIDSSGFSTSRFERWFDQKYGVTRNRCVWVKTHIACGVKTNVVTAVRILDKDSADSPQFTPLVKETAGGGFTVEEVSADKAYASVENFETVAECGGTGYLAFRSNATGGVGGLFEKMFHYFQYRREEFLRHYHQRSNVESTFSMIKRKFGDAVRSRTDTAMVNEVLCKILCHNLVVLNHEQHELGIAAEFWKDSATGCSGNEKRVPELD
jgi:transposase